MIYALWPVRRSCFISAFNGTILHDLTFVTTYLDDVLIHSPSIEEHESHLKVVFDRLQSAGLTFRATVVYVK